MTKDTSGRKRPLLLVRLLATLLLVGIVLRAVPLGETWTALRGLIPAWVAWALVIELAVRVISILRWHLLLPPAGVRLPFAETLRLGFIALFFFFDLVDELPYVARSAAAPDGSPSASRC